MEDRQAIQRLKRADLSGLEPLVEHYQVKAVRVAFLITHDEGLAEDAFQEVCLHLIRGIHQFDESRPFEPYLMRSVVHAAINLTRRERNWVPLDQAMKRLEALLTQPDVESLAETSQHRDDILSALAQLPPRQRAVIVLRYYLGMSEKEIAETLAAAPGTIKWHLNAARDRMRRLLRPERTNE